MLHPGLKVKTGSGEIMEVLLHIHLVAQTVKNLPAMQETQVQSPGREDPREKEVAIHSHVLAWRIS